MIETVNNTSCLTTYSGKVDLDDTQRYLLLGFDLAIMTFNILINIIVVIIMIITRQLQNTSLLLIFILCISDLCLGLITQPLFSVMIADYADRSYCDFETIVQFFAIFFTHTSAYSIAFIGFDRFCRMKYLTRYSDIMKKWVTVSIFTLIPTLSLFQATLYVLGTQLEFLEKAKKVTVGIDGLIALSVFVTYLLTVRIVRRHQQEASNVDMMQTADRIVTAVAARILLAVVIFYLPYIVVAAMYSNMSAKLDEPRRKKLSFALFITFLLTYCNSIANAAIFLSLNPKARKKMKFFEASTTKGDTGSTDL